MKIKSASGGKGEPIVLLTVASVICFLLSTAVIPFLFKSAFLPVPNLMLCFVCCIPSLASLKTSALFSLILGFLNDLFVSEPTSFSPIVFLVSVCLVCYFYTHFSRIGTHVMAVCSLPPIVLSAGVMTFAAMANFKDASALSVLTKLSLPYIAVNFAFAIITAFILRMITRSKHN